MLDLPDAELRGGKAGLCKFRQTVAEFREFRVGKDLSVKELSSEDRDRLNGALSKHQSEGASEDVIDELGRTSEQSRRYILDTVESLEQRIAELRALEGQVHLTSVERELIMALDRPVEEVDLFEVDSRLRASTRLISISSIIARSSHSS